jgi:hypothetical protein
MVCGGGGGVRDSAKNKNKLMGVMVNFLPAEK